MLYDFVMEDLINLLPKAFLMKMQQQLSKENFEKYKKALLQESVRGLRINKNRVDVKEFLKKTNLKLEPLDFCDDSFILKSDEKLGNSPEHLSGAIYLQEPSSALAVCASEIECENRRNEHGSGIER